MNVPVADAGGQVLVVSQFTLYGNTERGRRPSWIDAARPEQAEPLVRRVRRCTAWSRRDRCHRRVRRRHAGGAGQRRPSDADARSQSLSSARCARSSTRGVAHDLADLVDRQLRTSPACRVEGRVAEPPPDLLQGSMELLPAPLVKAHRQQARVRTTFGRATQRRRRGQVARGGEDAARAGGGDDDGDQIDAVQPPTRGLVHVAERRIGVSRQVRELCLLRHDDADLRILRPFGRFLHESLCGGEIVVAVGPREGRERLREAELELRLPGQPDRRLCVLTGCLRVAPRRLGPGQQDLVERLPVGRVTDRCLPTAEDVDRLFEVAVGQGRVAEGAVRHRECAEDARAQLERPPSQRGAPLDVARRERARRWPSLRGRPRGARDWTPSHARAGDHAAT